MKKKSIHFVAIIYCVLLTTTSCEKYRDYDEIDHKAASVEGPATGKKGEKIPFIITTGAGDCDKFGDIDDSKSGNVITIEMTLLSYQGPCTLSFSEVSKTYEFCERKAGTYLLKFKSYDGFIEKEIVIQ